MGSLHNELLAQAWHLAKKEPKHPLQASLRRAVSAAYYAVFHLLGRGWSKPHGLDRCQIATPATTGVQSRRNEDCLPESSYPDPFNDTASGTATKRCRANICGSSASASRRGL